ncbi:gliding motility-associated C-terminal domain-containing protein [Pontibacter liquoris]|uniref:Ig-like domain-containing protein n=1 Tax=Pontibacter liquoris TaxID=2905677 RepID=UPI001FA75C45|nr:gliding motility-associated C-terminal domain-containing protein [Pontibacter liquoris]
MYKRLLLSLLLFFLGFWTGAPVYAQDCIPQISASPAEASLCNNNEVTLTATAAASYQWSTGATTQVLKVTAPGTYSVKTTNADGCQGTSEDFVVTGPPDASISNPVYDFTYCSYSGSSAAFQLKVSNISTTKATNQQYVINWGDGTTDTYDNTFANTAHTYKAAGSYNLVLTVTGTDGCTSSSTERVFIGSNPGLGISSQGNSTGCAPATFDFKISGINNNSPYTNYTFQFDDGTPVLTYTQEQLEKLPRDPATNDVILTHTFSQSSSGKQNGFTLTGTAENPCSSSKATFEGIRISKGPEAKFGASSSTGCVNVPIIFTDQSTGGYDASTRTNVYNRNWEISPATGWQLTGGTLEDPRPSIKFTLPGVYTVKLTVSPLDPNSTCTGSSKEMTITISEPPKADFTLTGNGTCAPATFTTKNLSTGDDLRYAWQVSPTTGWNYATGSSATSATPSFTFTKAGTYKVILVASNNCSPSSQKETTIVIQEKPVVTLPAATAYCGPQTIAFAVANAAHAPTYDAKMSPISAYNWQVTGPAGASFTAGTSAASANPSLQFTTPGEYTVQVVATNGCGDSAPATQRITIHPLPQLTASSPKAAICLGEKTTIQVTGADTYTWSPATGLSATTGSQVTAAPTATTTYTITGKNTATNCTATTTFTVVVNNPPVVKATASVQQICLGQGTSTLTASGADTYTWAPATGLSSTTGASVIATPATTTTYTVTGVNQATGCSSSTKVTIQVNPLPVVNAGPDITICNKPVATKLAGSPEGGTWSGEHVSADGTFTPPVQTGTYELTYTYANQLGCTSSDKVVVTVEEAPVANAGSDQVVCLNSGAFSLQGFPAGGTWSGNQVDSKGTFTPAATGTFLLTYTFGTGSCATTDQVQVTVNALPQAPVVATPQPVCPGSGTSLQVSNPQGLIAWYDAPTGGQLLKEGATFDTPVLDRTTSYYVQTTIAGGCTSTRRMVTVTVHPATPAPVVDPVQLCGPGNTATLVANGTATMYEWYDAPTGGNLISDKRTFTTTALPASRSYYVQAIINGCISPRTEAKVEVYPVLSQNTLQGVATICAGQQPDVVQGSIPAGGDGSYTYQWESSITGAEAGFAAIPGTAAKNQDYAPAPLGRNTWFRRVVTSASCSNTSEAILVTVTPVIAGNTIALSGESEICQGSQGGEIVGSAPEGGNGTYTYTWQVSVTGAEGVYTAAPGDNRQPNYQPGTLTQSTWFRRIVNSGTCQQHISQPVRLLVYKPIAGNSISGEQIICAASSPLVLQGSQPSEGNSNYTFTWEMSTDGRTFEVATGQNNTVTYSPGPLTTTTWFRRIVSGGPCGINASNTVQVTVNPVITNNTITPVTPICSGQPAPELTGSLPAGGNGRYTFEWLASTTGANGTFTKASGNATNQTYAPGTLTQTTWYKRVVKSGECASTSPVVEVTVMPLPQAPTALPVTICENTTATLAVTEQTGTFRWYTSATAADPVFTGRTFTTPEPLTATTTYYVEAVNSSGCASATRVPVQVTVNRNISNNTLTAPVNQPICAGQTPAALTGTQPAGGNGTYTYRWESSTAGPNTGFAPITGATNSQYQPGALSANTWFRRVVISGPCSENYSAAVLLEVVPVISNNSITAAQTICAGDLPAAFSGSVPQGGTGQYTYLWESSTDGTTYTAAAGNNAEQQYKAPAPLTRTIWLRRIVLSGPCSRQESAPVKVTVLPAIAGNTLTSPEQTICAGDAPLALTGNTPTGGTGIYTYVWESSEDGTTYTTVAGISTNSSYQPQPLEKTTLFRRKVTSGACYSYSGTVRVVVNPGINQNEIAQSQEICTGSVPLPLTGAQPTGGNDQYTFRWEYSLTGAPSSFKAVAGNGTQRDYTPDKLTTTTWFRRVVVSGACTSVSNLVKIEVSPEIARNTIVLSQTIYAGQIPAPLTGSTPIGGNGSYTYEWQLSEDGVTYAAAPAPNTGKNYAPPALKKDTWFRRVVTSGGCSHTSEPVKISVTPAIGTNNIQADQVICYGNQPAILTGTKPMGGEGDYKFLWQASTQGPEAGWVTAAGNSSSQDYSPAPLTQTTWFRRIVISGTNTDMSAPVMITVKPAMSNNKISTSQIICYNTAPATLAGSLPTGGSGTYTYLWEMSTDGPAANFKTAPGANNRQDYTPPPLTRTTWFRRIVTSESCQALISNAVQVTITPLPAAPVAPAQTVCAGTSATLWATGTGGRLEWYASASGGNLLQAGNTYTTPVLTHNTTYYVQEISQTCASERTQVLVTVAEASASAGEDVAVVRGRSVELHASGGVTYSWSPAAGLSDATVANPVATPVETTTYTVTVLTPGGCTFTDDVTVTVLPFVDVPNTFTPNRDGINDTWEIANIEKYPNCTVEVFNQWGTLVFRSEGYGEKWDGRFNGQELPLATYYYVIRLNKTEKPLSGSITIVR